MSGREAVRSLAVGLGIVALMACQTPMAPDPPDDPPPPPPPANTPPVISSLVPSSSTIEVTEPIVVSATVSDAETGGDRLTLLWEASDGSFGGSGADVIWEPSLDLETPADVELTLTVVESYLGLDELGKVTTLEHRVSRSTIVRVHDSARELGEMGVSFLEKFADSSVPPDECLVDFSDNCRGKQSEREDIERNREHYLVLSSEIGEPQVSNLSRYRRADIAIPCSFVSRFIKCSPEVTDDCVVGGTEQATGTCRLTAVYEQKRWWLCDSRFSSSGTLAPAMRLFFGSDVGAFP